MRTPLIAAFIQDMENTLPSQIMSEVHSILSRTLDITFFVSIQLVLLSAIDVLVSFLLSFFGIVWHDNFGNLLLWFLALPLSAKQKTTSPQQDDEHLPTCREKEETGTAEAMENKGAMEGMCTIREQSLPSLPTNLLVFFISLERGSASKTGAYGMSGFSLLSLWQLCRLVAVAVPRGVIEGLATWMLLKEVLWYFRTRFGSHDTTDQEDGSSECTTCHGIPESQMSKEEV